MLEFNPVQTNQMPRREKLIQRFWELISPVFCGISPWFARRWLLVVLCYIAKMGEYENIAPYRFLCAKLPRGLSVEIVYG